MTCRKSAPRDPGIVILSVLATVLVLLARSVWWLLVNVVAPLLVLAAIGGYRGVRFLIRAAIRARHRRRLAQLAAVPRRQIAAYPHTVPVSEVLGRDWKEVR